MEKLDIDFINSQKAKLEAEKERLESEIKQIDSYPETGGFSEDDNSTEVEDFNDSQGVESDLQSYYSDVKEALLRIENGTYGYCDNCKKIIDKKRLEAYPAAKDCLDCGQK